MNRQSLHFQFVARRRIRAYAEHLAAYARETGLSSAIEDCLARRDELAALEARIKHALASGARAR